MSKTILFLASAAVVALSSVELLGQQRGLPSWSQGIAAVCIFWLAVHFACTQAYYKTSYLITNTYLVALAVFHLGIIIPHAFGGYRELGWSSPPFSMWLERSGWYIALVLGCFGIGFSISMKRNLQDVPVEVQTESLKTVYKNGLGLLLASMLLLIMALKTLGNLMNYAREDLYSAGVGDTRWLGVFMMVLPSAALALFIGAQGKQRLFANIVALFTFFMFLVTGYRSAALFPSLIGAVLWTKTGRRIPKVIAISFIAFVIVAIPVAGVLRGMGAYKDIGISEVDQSIQNATVSDGFRTMGQIAGILAHILELVPDTDPFRYGRSYGKALRDAIPNVGFSMAESVRTRIRQQGTATEADLMDLGPAEWLTYRILREQFDRFGGATGFSGIGEPYLNFGTPGVVTYFILIGFLLGYADRAQLLRQPKLLLFCCTMFWPLLRTVRNDFSNFVKPALFVFIIILIWQAASWFLGPLFRTKSNSHGRKSDTRTVSIRN